jgi:hypothetical protein
MFEQDLQNVEGLVLESDSMAVLADLAVTKIHLERAEAENPVEWTHWFHGPSNLPWLQSIAPPFLTVHRTKFYQMKLFAGYLQEGKRIYARG